MEEQPYSFNVQCSASRIFLAGPTYLEGRKTMRGDVDFLRVSRFTRGPQREVIGNGFEMTVSIYIYDVRDKKNFVCMSVYMHKFGSS